MSQPYTTSAAPPAVRLGRETVGDLDIAETQEWLVTNGIGGYASGTVAGSLSRAYHGLLVAAVHPPTDRRVMLVKLDETATVGGTPYDLTANRWASGAVAPSGQRHLESFELQGSVPVWRFRCAEVVLERRVWMEHGKNTTYVAYTVLSATEPVRLTLSAIADNRVFHNTGQVAWPVKVDTLTDGVRVTPTDPTALALVVRMANAAVTPAAELYTGFKLQAESARGLRDTDDHVHVATFTITVAPGATVILLAGCEPDASSIQFEPEGAALDRRRSRDVALLDRWRAARSAGAAPALPWVEQLVLAADQFIVDRPSSGQQDGKSVIAGYPWFGDWGRDTMISLTGLTLVTGRPEIAGAILETFSRYVDAGMLPNRFPDAGDTPEYNTVDATLWYFQAIRAYHDATRDDALLGRLYPVLEDIVDRHLKGTRYGIQVDATDGLLRWDAEGIQLTWMDAKVGDYVVTPRRGKPVEVNALWFNAVRTMASFARVLGRDGNQYDKLAEAALAGFDRFWNAEAGYCYDVLDGPDGNELKLRPNQIFAVALPECPLSPARQRAVVDICGRALLTSYGLRSLAPGDPAYLGSYGGDQYHRDSAYHQGTVWAWLIGPYVDAVLRVSGDPAHARRLLDPFADHVAAAGLGTISEIFEGDDPIAARGCIAQAWSVAEVLRALDRIDRAAGLAALANRTNGVLS